MIYIHSLGRAFRYYPDRTALVLDGGPVSFQTLHERVKAIAGALTAHGVKLGDRLALLLPNCPEYIELVYACSWLGVIAVPINARLSAAEIDGVLESAVPRGLVRHSSLPKPSVAIPWEVVLDEEPLHARGESCPEPIYDPEAILALIYTSGTTGRPKGVMVSHSNILANVDHFSYWMRYREGGVYLHAAPIFQIADFPAIFAAPAFGACQLTIPKFKPQSFCEVVERKRVTHTVLVPAMLNPLTQFREAKSYELTSLEVLAYGGSPIAPELVHRTRELLPAVKLLQFYGLTETGLLTGLEDHDHIDGRLLSCGRPCPGIELRIEDESGKEVEAGQHGELVARGANVMGAYWNNPLESAAAFRAGMFRTGDVGCRDADGFFYIVDRRKDMILVGAEKVYSGEVEAVLHRHPAVRETAVFGIPDPQRGESVMACIVLKPRTALSADDLIGYCRRFLANYKIPRRIEFSDAELPKGGSGKIQKRVLRERFGIPGSQTQSSEP
jgi:acyl-CoA synthetase (AMP-forming)/AMP-acid ligase II